MKTFIKYHLPAILYGIAILIVSSLPNLKSPEIQFWATDKVAHFLEYAVFAFLAFRSISQFGDQAGRGLALWLAFLLLIIFAVVDETRQGFIPGRESDLLDWVADVIGGLAIFTLLWFLGRRKASTGP